MRPTWTVSLGPVRYPGSGCSPHVNLSQLPEGRPTQFLVPPPAAFDSRPKSAMALFHDSRFPTGNHHRPDRAAALPTTLILLLCLGVAVAAGQHQTVMELRAAQARTHARRALWNAESGAAAYVHQLSQDFHGPAPLPSANPLDASAPGASDTVSTFRTGWRAQPSRFPLFPAPNERSGEGFTVGHRVVPGGIAVIAFGWCDGAVRGVRWLVRPAAIFDHGAAYALNPHSPTNPSPTGDQGPAWRFQGNAAVVGLSGSEGTIADQGGGRFYNGPVVLRGAAATGNTSFSPTPYASSPGDPYVAAPQGTIANPFVVRTSAPSGLPDIAELAQRRLELRGNPNPSSGLSGLASDNDNANGIRYIVRRSSPDGNGPVRQLSTGPSFGDPTNPVLDLRTPTQQRLRSLGMATNETYVGIRLYPGDFLATDILTDPQSRPVVFPRNHVDNATGVGPDGKAWTIFADAQYTVPARHPDPRRAAEDVVRIWLVPGKTTRTQPVSVPLVFALENPAHPLGFRVYTIHPAGFRLTGGGIFNGALVSFSRGTRSPSGTETASFGSIELLGNMVVYGSVLAWNLSLGGGAVVVDGSRSGTPAIDESRMGWVPVDCQEIP